MTRVRNAAIAIVAPLLLVACSQQEVEPAARISGTHDLVQVGTLIFVTSADRNELRVLDTTPEVPGFVRAPNPLEPLSIPVLDRPLALARDVEYRDRVNEDGSVVPLGLEVSGPYVYVMSSGAPLISIVGAERGDGEPTGEALKASALGPGQLVEVMRLPTAQSVTTIAGRAAKAPGGDSTLYYSTFDGRSSTLWSVVLPPPQALLAQTVDQVQQRAVVIGTFTDESVAALLPIPNGRLVVATRAQAGRAGRTLLVDEATRATTALAFPGPVRALATHPTAVGVTAGDRLFAVLDEEACGSAACAGILALDVPTNSIAVDITGQPMLPIRFGGALPRGFTVSPGALLDLPAVSQAIVTSDRGTVALGEPEPIPLAVLGIATLSNGDIAFFDAAAMRDIDLDPAGPSSSEAIYRAPPTEDAPEGAEQEGVGGGPTIAALTDGKVRDETVTVIYQGLLGPRQQPASPPAGPSFPTPPDLLGRVQVEDAVQLFRDGVPCGGEIAVAAVTSSTVEASALPADCAGWNGFELRAAGAQPFVVTGGTTGYMGRIGPNQDFAFQGVSWRRPEAPGVGSAASPQLAFRMGPLDPAVVRDGRFTFVLDDQLVLFQVPFEGGSVGCSLSLPSSVVHDGVLQSAFVAYPSANGLVEFEPAIVRRTERSREIRCYR